MLSAQVEISRLRSDLSYNEVPNWKVDKICDAVAIDINSNISDLVADALQSAVSAGVEIGADEFVRQLTVNTAGFTAHITTSSGKTDFSEPPFPMLPKLLQNAKVAKDGTRYKRIPIGKKSPKQVIDVFSAASQINDRRKLAKEAVHTDGASSRSGNPLAGVASFSGALTNVGKKTVAPNNAGAEPTIVTATSKQDEHTQWVIPAKERNMTTTLMDINRQLELDIDGVITRVIGVYREGYI